MDFNVGDLVQIREWDDMEDEFSTDSRGGIECKFRFAPEMKDLCGMEFNIKKISEDGEVYGHKTRWMISTDMIKHVDNSDFDTTDIDKFLIGFNLC